MKDIAKRMVQSKLPVVRPGVTAPTPKPASEVKNPLPTHSVYRQHDSWTVRNRREDFTQNNELPDAEAEPVVADTENVQPVDPNQPPKLRKDGQVDWRTKPRRGKLKPHKIRNTPVSVNMSAQEYEMVRDYVEAADISVSEWIRGLVFKAMGKTIPSRGRRSKG